MAGVESNIFNFGLIQHTTDTDPTTASRSWSPRPEPGSSNPTLSTSSAATKPASRAGSFKYTEEFERVQKERIARERVQPLNAKLIPAANGMKRSEINAISLLLTEPLPRWPARHSAHRPKVRCAPGKRPGDAVHRSFDNLTDTVARLAASRPASAALLF